MGTRLVDDVPASARPKGCLWDDTPTVVNTMPPPADPPPDDKPTLPNGSPHKHTIKRPTTPANGNAPSSEPPRPPKAKADEAGVAPNGELHTVAAPSSRPDGEGRPAP